MDTLAEMADRHRAGLTELGELGLALARDVQAKALRASDEATKAELTLAFHRVARSVRQTYALEAKLERDRRLAEREIASSEAHRASRNLYRKRAQVRHALTQFIWNEYETEDAELWTEALDSRLVIDLLPDDFAEAPLEDCIARLRADLGLPAANTPDDLPPDEPVEVVIWKSSG